MSNASLLIPISGSLSLNSNNINNKTQLISPLKNVTANAFGANIEGNFF